MNRILRTSVTIGLLALTLFAGFMAAAQIKPEDTKKLYAEISGDWDFNYQGESMIIQFFEKDGKLFGAPVGETPEELLPVPDKPLNFTVTVSGNGQFYECVFVRNDKKVIDTCQMTTQGMMIEGKKITKF